MAKMFDGGLHVVKDNITSLLDRMVKNGRDPRAFHKRQTLPFYKKLQLERFDTRNASQGAVWPDLNKNYEKRKLKKFASYPGSGSKMMIATSSLLGSITGNGRYFGADYFNTLIEGNSLLIFTTLEYAQYPADKRPFMTFKKDAFKSLANDYIKYMRGF